MDLSILFAGTQTVTGFLMCAGVIYAARQVTISKKQASISEFQSHIPVVTTYLSVFSEQELEALRIYIKIRMRDELESQGFDCATPIKDFPHEIAIKVQRVSHYLDHLGALVYHGYAKKEFISSFIGGEIEELWKVLESHIHAQRQVPGYVGRDYYQIHFEWLAKHCGKHAQREILRGLRREI